MQGWIGLLLVLLGMGLAQETLKLYSPMLGFPCVTLLDKDRTIGCTCELFV
jgi:hypothetical protein